MALVDTTSVIDNSIFLKAKLDKNMVGSNYYIENLQYKRDKDWEFRYNVVGIEEENEKQCDYTNELPNYTPIDVAIRTVKSDKGKDLGLDWANIAFKNLNHPVFLGKRFRFSTEFYDMLNMQEEEKIYKTSVWICINRLFNSGNSCVIRRCNANIAFGGSPNRSKDYITEVHYEPVILENDLKYINTYYNEVVPLPQAEWYATMQMNYFSNNIKINDRFILGGTDLDDRANNSVYKVKAVVKSTSNLTFAPLGSAEIENIPLIIIALDKDQVDEADDFYTRLADNTTVYQVKEQQKEYMYYIQMEEPSEQRILLGQTEKYTVNLYWNNKVCNGKDGDKDVKFEFSFNLDGVDKEKQGDYYKVEILSDNSFSIKNLKTYSFSNLIVTCKAIVDKDTEVNQSYEIELGSFY